MNIWEWVRQERAWLQQNGHGRLANIAGTISSHACNDRHEQVDTLFPEGLTLARALEHNWLELYLRHWNLQSRVLHRLDVSDMLREALDLLEFANREENKDCPHSVCTTQDIGYTYGILDGPGYANERIAVASETLERINPTWPCFTCISTEYSNALRDDGRPEDAEVFLREQMDLMERSLPLNTWEQRRNTVRLDLAWALLEQGKLEEALRLAETLRSESHASSENKREEHNIITARIWARMGQTEEALHILPPWEVIQPTPSHYLHTARTLIDVASRDTSHNTWSIGNKIWMMAERLERQGVARQAFELGMAYTNLALQRKVPHVATRGLELAQRAAAKLRDPREATGALEDLGRRVKMASARAPKVDLPESISDIEAHLTSNPEQDVLTLKEIVKRGPCSVSICSALTNTLHTLGWTQEAAKIYQLALEETPASEEKLRVLARWATQQEDAEFLNTLLSPHLEAHDPLHMTAHWLYARYYEEHLGKNPGLAPAMVEHLDTILTTSPDDIRARPLKAFALRSQGKWEEAWEVMREQIQRFGWEDMEEDQALELILIGSVTANWREVRRVVAKKLGRELENVDKPIEIKSGTMKIHINGDTVWARQVSPTAARINNLSPPGQPQYFGVMVAFDPRTKTNRLQHHLESEAFVPHASYLKSLTKSIWSESWEVRGLMPEELEVLKQSLRKKGITLYDRSEANYMVTHTSEPSRTHPGYRGLLIALRFLTPEQIHERLSQIVEEQGVSLAWPGLAKRVLATEDAQEMERFLKEWGIV